MKPITSASIVALLLLAAHRVQRGGQEHPFPVRRDPAEGGLSALALGSFCGARPNGASVPLFIYGSMRVGEPNEWRMRKVGAAHLGRAVLRGHRLYTARRERDQRQIAYAVVESGHSVVGDLFMVPAGSLAWIDGFEGAPRFYARAKAPVVRMKPGAPALLAYFYPMPRERLPPAARPCRWNDWRACQGAA